MAAAQLSEGNMSSESSSKPDKTIRTLQAVTNLKITCTSPNRDLVLYPKWLYFQSENQYKTPQFAKFFIENRESFPIAFNIKAREKIFRCEWVSGILAGGEKRVIRLFLLTSDDWPLAPAEYSQKRLKVAVESLRVPDEIQPKSVKEGALIAKYIWKRSYNEWPLERLYTKINIALAPPHNSPQVAASTVTTKFTV